MATPNLPKAPEPSAGSGGFSTWAKDLVTYLTKRLGDIADTISERALFSVRRLATPTGTALAAGNVAIGAGWGATATFTVAGNDQRGSVTVTANGAGLAANATITITFVDGPWRVTPFATAVRAEVVAPAGSVSALATTTTLVLTNHTLPVAGSVYTIAWNLLG